VGHCQGVGLGPSSVALLYVCTLDNECKDCLKQAEESSAQIDRPRHTFGKRSVQEAGLGEGGEATAANLKTLFG